MVVILQNHSGIPTVLQVSCGGAATDIVQIVQQRAIRRHHTLFILLGFGGGGGGGDMAAQPLPSQGEKNCQITPAISRNSKAERREWLRAKLGPTWTLYCDDKAGGERSGAEMTVGFKHGPECALVGSSVKQSEISPFAAPSRMPWCLVWCLLFHGGPSGSRAQKIRSQNSKMGLGLGSQQNQMPLSRLCISALSGRPKTNEVTGSAVITHDVQIRGFGFKPKLGQDSLRCRQPVRQMGRGQG